MRRATSSLIGGILFTKESQRIYALCLPNKKSMNQEKLPYDKCRICFGISDPLDPFFPARGSGN
jgi:hypothetical protein